MQRDERLTLSRILLEVSQEMLVTGRRSWQVLEENVAPPALSGTLASAIGLSSTDGLRGKLVIIGQPDLFRWVYPAGLAHGEISANELADWAAELANQLLGRIKNRLSAHGVNFSMSTPTVIGGDRINLLGRDRPSCLGFAVRIDGHRLDMLMEVERADDQRIFTGDGQAVAAAPEGSALLF